MQKHHCLFWAKGHLIELRQRGKLTSDSWDRLHRDPDKDKWKRMDGFLDSHLRSSPVGGSNAPNLSKSPCRNTRRRRRKRALLIGCCRGSFLPSKPACCILCCLCFVAVLLDSYIRITLLHRFTPFGSNLRTACEQLFHPKPAEWTALCLKNESRSHEGEGSWWVHAAIFLQLVINS